MEQTIQEKKKECGTFIGLGSDSSSGSISDEELEEPSSDSSSGSISDEELEEPSSDILDLIGGKDKTFESEKELEEKLREVGIGDLRVVLVGGKPFIVLPSDQHNNFTTEYVNKISRFLGWWGCASGTHKVHLSNNADNYYRYPDVSGWGYLRCKPGCLEPIHPDAIPDFVIQFIWKNKMWYEENALDDMMTNGLEQQDDNASSTTLPRLGYLIKVRFSKKRKLNTVSVKKTQDMVGLDIYRLSHGTTLRDARDINNHNAEFVQYSPGGPEVLIIIKPEHLGITGLSAMFCRTLTLKASEIFHNMDECHKDRQARGLAT